MKMKENKTVGFSIITEKHNFLIFLVVFSHRDCSGFMSHTFLDDFYLRYETMEALEFHVSFQK